MFMRTYAFFLITLLINVTSICEAGQVYPWAVVGAGPAGIISIAVLLENGVDERDIVWVDPEFKVGRLGQFYGNVPSNHQAHQFVTFLNSCEVFQKINSPACAAVEQVDQYKEHKLQLIIDPLQDITDYLRRDIVSCCDTVRELTQQDDVWRIALTNSTLYADKVILAPGSFPKTFSYEGPEEILLDLALDEAKLQARITHDDTIMVIGSAHSALLILKYLSEFPIKKIINIYTKLPSYVKNRSLSGITAWWTQEVLEKNPPENLTRILFYDGVIEDHIKECNKIIYAFGYERNAMLINGSTDFCFDDATGIILPNLYGIGIAFPRERIQENGEILKLVGVNAFTNYAKELVPQWIRE